jgi:hypothetical protein
MRYWTDVHRCVGNDALVYASSTSIDCYVRVQLLLGYSQLLGRVPR